MVNNVVVGFDFTPGGRLAVQRAISLATKGPPQVLHFLCVVEPHHSVPGLPNDGHADLAYCERVQAALTDAVLDELRLAAMTERANFCIHVRIGRAAEEILALAREVGADTIILGKRELEGVARLLLGSVTERVARDAGCTVEIARPKTYSYVERYEMREVEPTSHYIPPHRYTYEQPGMLMRPDDWPLY